VQHFTSIPIFGMEHIAGLQFRTNSDKIVGWLDHTNLHDAASRHRKQPVRTRNEHLCAISQFLPCEDAFSSH
jgi:hypothetical protein